MRLRALRSAAAVLRRCACARPSRQSRRRCACALRSRRRFCGGDALALRAGRASSRPCGGIFAADFSNGIFEPKTYVFKKPILSSMCFRRRRRFSAEKISDFSPSGERGALARGAGRIRARGGPPPFAAKAGGPRAKSRGILAKSRKPNHATQGKTNHALQGKPNHATQGKTNHALQGKTNHALQSKPNHATQGKPNHATQSKPNHATQGKTNHAMRSKPNHAKQGPEGLARRRFGYAFQGVDLTMPCKA